MRRKVKRRGLTLAELLVAASIMLMIAAAVGTLASAVKSTNDYCQGYTTSAQHARVALSRIERAVTSAFASELFPACLIVSEQAGSELLPNTLVVWNPTTGTVANPDGLPLIGEIVIFSFDPARPNTLIEVRSPAETGTVPAVSDTGAWRTLTERLLTSNATTKTTLTDRLRTSPLTGEYRDTLSPSDLRGAIRFRRIMAPTDQEWTLFQAGLKTRLAWASLNWPLGMYSFSYSRWTGIRTVVCQTELQIAPGNMASSAVTALPFFGSATRSYQMTYTPN
jgi:hypothetical protein